MAETGVKWIRVGFRWEMTELRRGIYNFTLYDQLTDILKKFDLGALYILAGTNPLYDQGLPPHTDEGRAAFAAWSTAAALHFKEEKIVWEMYNEPNIAPAWKPKPNATAYTLLATAVGESLRTHTNGTAFVGPATSQVDFIFLEECFKVRQTSE